MKKIDVFCDEVIEYFRSKAHTLREKSFEIAKLLKCRTVKSPGSAQNHCRDGLNIEKCGKSLRKIG